jgi:class 3 adenylate cyclase/predicted ATPase
MTFDEVLAQVQALLQREQRISYRGLKRRFALDDEYLEDLKEELIGAKRLASDEDGRFLVWTGDQETEPAPSRLPSHQPLTPPAESRSPEAERRQLTVMFCDLVGSTALSAQLDPEELRELVRAYHETCTEVIRRYDGHIAQHLGDGLLVYFGYPAAHEDDPRRAVRTGLEIIEALHHLSPRLPYPFHVRIGIHTGLVVVGEIGSSERREILALGDTPNLTARIQGVAEPDTVVTSAATHRLVQGLFECQDLGPQMLKGIAIPLTVYQVIGESTAQSRFEVAVSTGLTPLVGREEELGLLQRCWTQAKDGAGQVVLLSGEPGIGKSRLVQVLKDQIGQEKATRIEFRCSPYHQNSAFYPIIEHLQRLLQFHRQETPQAKLAKLQQALVRYRFPQADTLPLLAALLSLPHPEGYAPLTLSPQKQKQKTQEALVAWIMEAAANAAVYCAWEDLHWADPSTLEVLTLFLEQIPTTRVFAVLTFRLDFTPPWSPRSYLTPLTLSRLPRTQVEEMVTRLTGGKALPPEVLRQVVSKTDGVPLFVEELAKMVLESGLLREVDGHYDLTGSLPPLAIPNTLQDSLMARLDRLAPSKEVVQLGATLGREFSYDVLQAVSALDAGTLQRELARLVDAEFLFQRGLPPQAQYVFKHALIQDAAYQSLLKSTRQHYHTQIAHVLEERFPETAETQPELLAHHYTEAGLIGQAIPYWQRAGQRAIERSANTEAIAHLTTGLQLLKTQPDTVERVQRELQLQIMLGTPLTATKGFAAPETGAAYARARELCQQLGETPQLFPTVMGLYRFYSLRRDLQRGYELAAQGVRLAQRIQDPVLLIEAYRAQGGILYWLGEFARACKHIEQALALYDPQQHRSLGFVYGLDPGVVGGCILSWALWALGYPDQALQRSQAAVALARGLSHTHSLAVALFYATALHDYCGKRHSAQEWAEELISLATEQGLMYWLALGTFYRGSVLAEQGQYGEGIVLMRQGITAHRAIGAHTGLPGTLGRLADVYGQVRRVEEGLRIIDEGFAVAWSNGEPAFEAELWRVKGQLTRQQFADTPQAALRDPQLEVEAEECFQKAVEIARHQQAKSWELRAVMSLSRLWQSQGKTKEAHVLLSEIYGWFSEGFNTKDLQEAKALLEELH